ncbi:MAG: hypothetical protein ACJ70Z_02155 [Nitrososphaera sp.]
MVTGRRRNGRAFESSHIPTAQSSSSYITGSSQERDGDGRPDSSDRCANNSNPRCFKEAT